MDGWSSAHETDENAMFCQFSRFLRPPHLNSEPRDRGSDKDKKSRSQLCLPRERKRAPDIDRLLHAALAHKRPHSMADVVGACRIELHRAIVDP